MLRDGRWNQHLMKGLSSIKVRIYQCIKEIQKIHQVATPSVQLATSYVSSNLLYGASTWSPAPEYIYDQLQTAQLNAAHALLGHSTIQWNTACILHAVGWAPVRQMVRISAIRQFHTMLHTQMLSLISSNTWKPRQCVQPDTQKI